jgi:hypothetical protein
MQVKDIIYSEKRAEFVYADGEWFHRIDGHWWREKDGSWADPDLRAALDHEIWIRRHKPFTKQMIEERVRARKLAEAERDKGGPR